MRGMVRDVAALLAWSACAFGASAQGAPHPSARPMFAAEAAATARPLDPAERDARAFLKQAAASSRFQSDAARLALAKSSNAAVRALAGALRDEHAAAGDDLLRMLHQRGLAAPMLANLQRRTLTRLGRVQARKFDREYVEAVARESRDEAAACERAAGVLQDAALANWIAVRLPALRADAQQAQQVLAGMPAPAAHAPHASRLSAHRHGRRHHPAE